LLQKLEKLLSNKLRLKVDRSKPDLEIREGYGIVGLRLTHNPNYEKTLHKGELSPKLAHIMCLLADLNKHDVVLDPFAGYGSIPIECARNFKVKQVIASEKDKGVFRILQEKTKKLKSKIITGRWNALDLVSLRDNSIDKIITDPPWGFYNNKKGSLREFYKIMFDEFIRVLKPGGLIIILMGQKELFSEIISNNPKLNLINKYDTLVSGKKLLSSKSDSIRKCLFDYPGITTPNLSACKS
jgi:tRNA G10  N-methylase Trm11